MEPYDMSNGQLNDKIAVICGWESGKNKDVLFGTVAPRTGRPGNQMFVKTAWRRPGGPWEFSAPNYADDLNAMHGAEGKLFDDPDIRDKYVERLMAVTGLDQADIWHATARQRAEAFLMAMRSGG
jgi:hypothetical protein